MKKILFLVLILGILTISTALFAQASSQEILIQSVTGIVTYEASAGKWEAVTVDKKLAPSTVINTGLNSSLVLKMGDRVVTIKAMQKGTVEKLASAVAAGPPTLKLGSAVANSSVTADPSQARTNISTASTRASDATGDVEWAEEKKE